MTTPPDIRHQPDRRRFTTTVDGHEAELEYRIGDDGFMDITHVTVPDEIGGRGIASQLTLAAFEQARTDGLNVRPSCPYAAAWAERHPEFSQLLG
ncbi:MAG: GNAT family N-acetyltransferase [Lysobacter sp.]